MKLHLLGIAHTRPWHTHCAFTGKVVKFPTMMRDLPYHVVYYGIDGDDIGQHESHPILSAEEQVSLLGHDFSDHTRFHGDDANIGNPLYQTFNSRLGDVLASTVSRGDIVLFPFGHAHQSVVSRYDAISLESGIGYPTCFLPFRVYESFAWMHYHQGKDGRNGNHYEWVIPNYFVGEDWTYHERPDNYVLYFGRLNDIKGLPIVVELAKRMPHQQFIICGQGDPTPYLTAPNIDYHPPVLGKDRDRLLGQAKCLIAPSMFTEPFAGVAVEAMMTGTPVLSTTFGAFTETIEQGVTGFRCHTLADFAAGVNRVDSLDRRYIYERAHRLYALAPVSVQYDRVFQQLHDLYADGWYSQHSHWV